MALRHHICWALVATVIGCARSPEPVPGTGAKECVHRYYEALVQRDWSTAYAALDAESQTRRSLNRFTELAQSYLASIGFEPEKVQLWNCEERDAEATARVVFRGRAASQGRRYNEAVTLQRSDDGWQVVLPLNFGTVKKR
jgi:hypothetical protein